MEFLKNLLCNIPLYFGLLILSIAVAIKKLSEQFMNLSFRMHIVANTEAGVKLKEYREMIRQQVQQMKEAQQDSQLAKILLNRGSNGAKRPTDN